MFFSSHLTSHLIADYSVFIVRKGRGANPTANLIFAISFEPKARMATLPSLVWKKLAAHGDLYPVALGIFRFANLHRKVDRTRDTVAELLVNQLLDGLTIDQSDFVKSGKLGASKRQA
jgi:hypothetical protein